jgi:hypothetical protein
MIQDERSIIWVSVRKKFHMNMCLILSGYWERELFQSPDLTPFHFSLWGWIKSAVH